MRNSAIDFDPYERSLFADGRRDAVFSRLRQCGALPIDTRGPVPVYSLLRHADIARAYGDPDLYSPCAGLTLDSFDPAGRRSPSRMLEMAPPGLHRALRSAMQGAFQVGRQGGSSSQEPAGEEAGGELTQTTEALVERFLARAVDGDAIDFVGAFAREAASATMSALLGASPSEAAALDPALRAVGAIDFGMSSRSIEHRKRIELWLLRELTRVVRAHRAEERPGGLLERLLGAEIDGRALSEHEVALNCLNVVLAGTGATQHTLAGAMAVWSAHPEDLDDVAREPVLAHGLTEETLRWLTPVTHLTRVLTRSVEILGHDVPRGAGVCLWNVSGNRDEEVFEEPASFKADRARNRHLAFGIGPQYCLGAQIVRMQLRAMLTGMLRHGVRLHPLGPPVWMPSNAVAGVESLPLCIRRERPAHPGSGPGKPACRASERSVLPRFGGEDGRA